MRMRDTYGAKVSGKRRESEEGMVYGASCPPLQHGARKAESGGRFGPGVMRRGADTCP